VGVAVDVVVSAGLISPPNADGALVVVAVVVVGTIVPVVVKLPNVLFCRVENPPALPKVNPDDPVVAEVELATLENPPPLPPPLPPPKENADVLVVAVVVEVVVLLLEKLLPPKENPDELVVGVELTFEISPPPPKVNNPDEPVVVLVGPPTLLDKLPLPNVPV